MRRFTWGEKTALAWKYATDHSRVQNFNLLGQEHRSAWQFDRVRQLVDIAYHRTELYRNKYDAAGIHPRDIRTWLDFACLPTLSKEELVESGLRAVDSRRDPKDLFVSKSSGSSGEFVSVYLDARAMSLQAVQVVRMIKEMYPAYSPLDHELLIYTSEYPYSSIAGLYRADYAHTLLPTRKLIERIASTRPAVIAVYPSILKDIIRFRDSGEPMRHLQVVITNSEQSLQEERDYFARQLGCAVRDEFSSEELFSIAYQCRHLRYHVTQDSSYIEVLSPTADAAMPTGQLGEIVGTCLINAAMPIIRYRQGDLASLRERSCPCGRIGPVLEALAGRKNDSFPRPDGTQVLSGRILDWTYGLILVHRLGILEFQVTQQSTQDVEIQLVVDPTYNALSANQIIEDDFRRTFGGDFTVTVKVVPTIARTISGKHNPIRSLVLRN